MWRAGGALALVDMRGGARNGRVTRLAREGIERFWVAGAPALAGDAARRALVLLDIRRRGTARAWHVPFSDALPSWLAPAHGAEDPELELDRESYPLCVRLGARGVPAVAGCAQRLLRRRLRDAELSAPFFRRFAPAPTSQPVLPARCATCSAAASGTPRSRRRAPPPEAALHHALEWLLFSRAGPRGGRRRNAPRGENARRESSGKKPIRAAPIRCGGHRAALADAARLIREFPEFTDVVASVARKTDAEQWPALFAVAGEPRGPAGARPPPPGACARACYLLVVAAATGRARAALPARGGAVRLLTFI